MEVRAPHCSLSIDKFPINFSYLFVARLVHLAGRHETVMLLHPLETWLGDAFLARDYLRSTSDYDVSGYRKKVD